MFDNGTDKKDVKKDENKKVEKKRAYHLNENVSSASVKVIIQGILDINKFDEEQEKKDPSYVREPITLVIDSYGGSIYDGFGLMGVIDTSLTPVHGYCYSKAMSMGFAIYIMCHKRFAHYLAEFMYHDGATSLGGTLVGIQQSLDQSKKLVAKIDEYVLRYTDMNRDELDEIKDAKKDLYITTAEALELGIVDEILQSTRHIHRKQETV